MRYALIGLAFVGGCTMGEGFRDADYIREEPSPEGADLQVDPSTYESVNTSELGTDRIRPIAKTIEWPAIGTEVGTRFVGGSVVVERIQREDSDNSYGVRVRLKNTTDKVLRLEYLISFYTRQGVRLAAYLGGVAATERWKPFVIEPLKYEIVEDFSRMIGADGFKLHVRSAGSKGTGDPQSAEDLKKSQEDAKP
jgi:hypothetical protein